MSTLKQGEGKRQPFKRGLNACLRTTILVETAELELQGWGTCSSSITSQLSELSFAGHPENQTEQVEGRLPDIGRQFNVTFAVDPNAADAASEHTPRVRSTPIELAAARPLIRVKQGNVIARASLSFENI